jgi:hypothetical protein
MTTFLSPSSARCDGSAACDRRSPARWCSCFRSPRGHRDPFASMRRAIQRWESPRAKRKRELSAALGHRLCC